MPDAAAPAEYLKPPIPLDEDARVEDLRRLGILLTTPEKPFDDITRELARVFDVSAVVMSFLDRDTSYYKSAIGLPPDRLETRVQPRETSLCSHVIGTNEPLVVEDLLADDRFRYNPDVVDSGVRFYAGAPLRADSGRAVGSLCVVDRRPRRFSDRERELLHMVAEGAMTRVKLQSASAQLLHRAQQVERELRQAERVQRFALPPERLTGDGWRLDHLYRPFEYLGGDFLDVLKRPDGRLAILIADVSGHGTSAALTSVMTKTVFQRLGTTVPHPAGVLDALNHELFSAVPPDRFMTALVAFHDPGENTLEFASAGHPHPLLIGPNAVEPVHHENEIPLLIDPTISYRQQTSLQLPADSRVLLYTDGAVEITDADGHYLNVDGLARAVRAASHLDGDAFLQAILSRLLAHGSGRLQDDVALMCLESFA